MEQVVQFIFLGIALLAPFGVVAGLSFRRAATKALAEGNPAKFLENKTRSIWRFIGAGVDGAIGLLGYYVISRRVFPRIDAALILLVLLIPSAVLHIFFSLRLNRVKQTLLNFLHTRGYFLL